MPSDNQFDALATVSQEAIDTLNGVTAERDALRTLVRAMWDGLDEFWCSLPENWDTIDAARTIVDNEDSPDA